MVNVGTNDTGRVGFVNLGRAGDPATRSRRSPATARWVLSDCTFVQWDPNLEGRHAIQVKGENPPLRGCQVQEDKPQVEIGPVVRKAVVAENLIQGRRRGAHLGGGLAIL
jgi:hypothetical protein